MIKGVAVSLKLFLKLLEKHGIEHPEEKVVRQQLSPRGVAAGGSTVPLTCVCVSQRCIPQNTLDILMDTKGITY